MTDNFSPWRKRFDGLLDLDVIRAKAENYPVEVIGLLELPPQQALLSLKMALEECVVLSDTELEHLAKLLGRSAAYTAAAYPDSKTFLAQMHKESIDTLTMPPVCLTGLAGVGKSTFLTAFERTLPVSGVVTGISGLLNSCLPTESSVRTQVEAATSFVDLLDPWLPREQILPPDSLNIVKHSPRRRLDAELRRAAKWSYRMGRSASIVDEMQFLSQGSEASAQITKFLLMLMHIRVPLIYAANYSLCHKLMKRNQEDRDRLLADVIVLKPLEPNERGLGRLLHAYSQVLAPYLEGDLNQFFDEYASWTLGIRRKVRELTVSAFGLMRERGDTILKINHISKAYHKEVSNAFRLDIEDLNKQSARLSPVKGKMDLWCPFGKELNQLNIPSVVPSSSRAQEISNIFLRQSLTAKERRTIAAFESSSRNVAIDIYAKDKSSAPSKEKSSKKEITPEELLKNTQRYIKD